MWQRLQSKRDAGRWQWTRAEVARDPSFYLRTAAIRVLVSAIMMFSTALSPLGFGALIDLGVSIDTLALASGVYTVCGIGFLYAAQVRDRRLRA